GCLLELRLDAGRLDDRRPDRRQCIEQRRRTLEDGDTRVGTVLDAPHEQAQRIETREDDLDRGAIQRTLLLAHPSAHVPEPIPPQPTVYAAPLSVWTARNSAASSDSLEPSPSSATSDCAIDSRCSTASGRKYSRTSCCSVKNRSSSSRRRAVSSGGAGGVSS